MERKTLADQYIPGKNAGHISNTKRQLGILDIRLREALRGHCVQYGFPDHKLLFLWLVIERLNAKHK
jgi:hypothetical protein